MRTRGTLTLIAGLLLSHSFAQTLTLINGDANGDQVIDDTDLLAVMFAQGLSCSDCPEDLKGDGWHPEGLLIGIASY